MAKEVTLRKIIKKAKKQLLGDILWDLEQLEKRIISDINNALECSELSDVQTQGRIEALEKILGAEEIEE